MKHHITALLAATLIVGVTGCDGGAPQAFSSSTTNPSRTVPDVVGAKFKDARDAALKSFIVHVLGKDGKKWVSHTPDKNATITSTKPAAGTVTAGTEIEVTVDANEAEMDAADEAAMATASAVAKAADAASKIANRYAFFCGLNSYPSYKEVWVSTDYPGGDNCRVLIDGKGIDDNPALLKSEHAIADVVAANGGGGGGSAASDFGRALLLCAKVKPGYADDVMGRMSWRKAEARGALALCPEAPHAAVLQDVIEHPRIGDGTNVVGKDMDPGTYQTKPGAKDCYWARTTGGGNIIANNFVGFAPEGVTVTVYPGEGFESQRCGVWTKIG